MSDGQRNEAEEAPHRDQGALRPTYKPSFTARASLHVAVVYRYALGSQHIRGCLLCN